MKYILLIYSEEGVWPPDELAVARDESVQLCHELDKQGHYLGAAPLHPASTATCVRVRDGQRTVSDGPYAETKEQLAGYFLIDVASLDEAIRVAASIPGTRRGTTEIRSIIELPGMP
ncbi:YciI family protein [Stieleria varia]|uniref:YCII-related domain protein n=1 Tax=Stieleria varia TaxID=2528005 RepID=A0A5C6B564_9BACT|nr:YciI family protein [Stieleria varia]TWU07435.1 YCII-related domain protein [Stieleria varia]